MTFDTLIDAAGNHHEKTDKELIEAVRRRARKHYGIETGDNSLIGKAANADVAIDIALELADRLEEETGEDSQ